MDDLLNPQTVDSRRWRGRKEEQKSKIKNRYDQSARDLKQLDIGEHVQLLDMNSKRWTIKGVVHSKLPNRSYLIKTEYGEIRRRNRRHIRPLPQRQNVHIPSDDISDDDDKSSGSDHDEDDVDTPTTATPTSGSYTTRSGRRVKPPDKMNL